MKKLLFIPLALLALFGSAQVKKQMKTPVTVDSTSKKQTKYNDNVDDRMKGPNGEKVFMGPNGGRYYMKGTQKVYVTSAASKKKKGA